MWRARTTAEKTKDILHLCHETTITLPFQLELIRQCFFLLQERPVLQFQLSQIRALFLIPEFHLRQSCASVQYDGVFNHTRRPMHAPSACFVAPRIREATNAIDAASNNCRLPPGLKTAWIYGPDQWPLLLHAGSQRRCQQRQAATK